MNLEMIKLARKAFREGSNIFGEKIIGYTKEGFHLMGNMPGVRKTYPLQYGVVLKLQQADGKKCATTVGFKVHMLTRKGDIRSAEQRFNCEASPYDCYITLISGHEVFSIPVTRDMLQLFPNGLNKLQLDEYTWQELEQRALVLKEREMRSYIHQAKMDMYNKGKELGFTSMPKIDYGYVREDGLETDDDLPF